MSFNQGQDETSNSSSKGSSSKYQKDNNAFVQDENAKLKKEVSRILLMGLRGSGKTSLVKVVFENMSPKETLSMKGTNAVRKYVVNSSEFLKLKIYEFPGNLDFNDPQHKIESLFQSCNLIIFVIDAQDCMTSALDCLQSVLTKAYNINYKIKCDVFIHKTDGLSEDSKLESQRDIYLRANKDLLKFGKHNIFNGFYLTTIHDYSVYEAFSKVVQKLIPQYSLLQNFLNIITSTSKIDKIYMFDIKTKIYIATNSSPVDMQCYELCCDTIDYVIDLSNIYGSNESDEELKDSAIPAIDEQSSCIIKINNGTVLYLKEVSSCLVLICILREENFETLGVVDYNFGVLRNGLRKLYELNEEESSQSSKKSQAEDLK